MRLPAPHRARQQRADRRKPHGQGGDVEGGGTILSVRDTYDECDLLDIVIPGMENTTVIVETPAGKCRSFLARKDTSMEEGVEEYPLTGFDPDGEPFIRRTAAGRLWLCIEFMPPSWEDSADLGVPVGLGPWADFDKRLEQAVGVRVVWEDREWFRIDRPTTNTVSAIQEFLVSVRRQFDPREAEKNT